jgi:hypothetical protein
MDETYPGIVALRRKSPDSDNIEAIVVRVRDGERVVVVDLGPYKTSPMAQELIRELGAPDHFDHRTAELMWVPDIDKIRWMLGVP